MFRSIFRPYGPVWNFLNTITDALALSLIWCFCSLPLITLGAATTALYDAAVHGIRYREAGLYHRFFRTFRSAFKTTSAVTALWGVILLFGGFVLTLLNAAAEESTQAAIMGGAYRVIMLFPISAFCWSAIILSRFDQSFRKLTVTSLQFLIVHFFSSAAIAIVTWLAVWYCASNLLALTFLPAVTVLVWSLFAEAIFRKLGAGLEQETTKEHSAEE